MNMKSTSKKISIVISVVTTLLVVALLTMSVILCLSNGESSTSTSGVSAKFMAEVITHDPTKLDLPAWVIDTILIMIYVIIGVLGTGIICYLIYIITWSIKRRTGTLSAQVSHQEEEHEGNPNLVKLTLGEEVANEKSN